MRLKRSKFVSNVPYGKDIKLRRITEPEFLIYAKKELGLMFAEAVTEKSPERFADIVELVNNVCEKLNIDFYDCMRIRTEKRFKEGKYEDVLAHPLNAESKEDT